MLPVLPPFLPPGRRPLSQHNIAGGPNIRPTMWLEEPPGAVLTACIDAAPYGNGRMPANLMSAPIGRRVGSFALAGGFRGAAIASFHCPGSLLYRRCLVLACSAFCKVKLCFCLRLLYHAATGAWLFNPKRRCTFWCIEYLDGRVDAVRGGNRPGNWHGRGWFLLYASGKREPIGEAKRVDSDYQRSHTDNNQHNSSQHKQEQRCHRQHLVFLTRP